MSACDETKIQAELITLYTKLAEKPGSDFGWNKGKANARQLGYSETWLERLPEIVWESAAAVGNPFKLGKINAGQTVLDIGCGAGADACVAALLVGNSGKVIGVDCTPAMIEKARLNARHAALNNIDFHEADITGLPVADNSIDVVISNGAINLSKDKYSVFQELFRILKPGGRLQIADMVRISEDSCVSESTGGTWANCVQGTLTADKLLEIITETGFTDAILMELTGYRTSNITNGALVTALRP